MTNTAYIRNMETGKIELHFEKSEYQALPDSAKKQIKSNFLFSRYSGAWVSRAKEPNLYWAIKVANELGFTTEQRTGERITFAEQMERKVERAEARADRFETYASNAAHRAERLQAEFNSHHGDIAYFTQPNINSSAGRAFTNQRNKVLARYEKGFDEYRKSDYFKSRAAVAMNTAQQTKLNDPGYLEKRIKECDSNITKLTKNATKYEETLYNKEHGLETDWYWGGDATPEKLEKWITDTTERIEAEIDKKAYYRNALDAIGGLAYSKANIKPGYIVKIRGSQYQIVKANPKTVDARVVSGGAAGMVLNYNYGEIQDIINAEAQTPKQDAEAQTPKQDAEAHPYQEGQILTANGCGSDRIIRAYQVTKRTDKTIMIQAIEVKDGKPQPGAFKPGSKPERKKPTVRAWSNEWAVCDSNEWLLHRYNA